MSSRLASISGNGKFTSEEFDPTVHTWAKFYGMSEGEWKKRTQFQDGRVDASPEKVFEEVEATLALNNYQMLREAIAKETGVVDANIADIKVALVNRGMMQAILRIDVQYGSSLNAIQPLSLIGIVTLHNDEKAQQYSQKDYATIAKLREHEASRLGFEENSSVYSQMFATFPPRDGEALTPSGHHLQLTRLLEGFYEVNLRIQKVPGRGMVNQFDRAVVINRWTQGALSETLKGKESEFLTREIITHQLTTAMQCHVALAPSFSAGDYLYSPEQGRLVLHTAPEREHDEDGDIWRKVQEQYPFPQGSVDPKVYYAAFQILHMLTAHEGNLYTLSHDEDAPQYSVFAYEIGTLIGALEDMSKKNDLLSRNEWREVAKLLPRWVEFVFNKIGKPQGQVQGVDGKVKLSVAENNLISQRRILADRLKECVTRIFAMTMNRVR